MTQASFNCTFMELKLLWLCAYYFQETQVLIVPLWN